MNKIANNHEDILWLDKVYKNIQHSVNDMPFLRILNKLKNSIEKHKIPDQKLSYLQDSMLVTDTTIPISDDTTTNNPTCKTPHIFNISDTTNNVDQFQNYDGHNWIKTDDEKWKPPPKPPDPAIIPNTNNHQDVPAINKTNMSPQIQNDSGANRIVTDNMSSLRNVQIITPIPMGGCNKNDEAAITCTAIGQLPIRTIDGQEFLTKAYYSAEVDGTIISPTAMVKQHITSYNAWLKYCDCDNREGTLKLVGRDNIPTLSFKIYCHNDLWYHDNDSVGDNTSPTINHLSNAATYELWHQRTAHAGLNTLETLHKHVNGVPALKGNAFYRCPSCMSGKLCTKRSIGKPTTSKGAKSQQHKSLPVPPKPTTTNKENLLPGQHFAMDFGFVRGSDYHHKTSDGSTVTSIDGMNSYLSIIDRATRYMWVFVTKSKSPPLEAVEMILNKFKSTHTHRTVRSDQGGELGKSANFTTLIAKCGFSLELTGADASAQNGIIENPNKTFGQMMRCLLYSSELGPEYWTYALQHAVYIRNRLPHHSTSTTPYEALTGNKPDLSGLRIFGSRIYARKPGKRTAKLDTNSYKGYFLGFTATDKNVLYIDEETGRVKTGTHVIFDEAHMSVAASKAPLAAQTLQRLGYYSKEDWVTETFNTAQKEKFLVQHLTSTAITPTRSTTESIGYDLHLNAPNDIIIPAGTIMPLHTGIAIQCPSGTYARIAPRSGLTIKNNLTTLAGVIDPDYRGDVTVLLQNFGNTHQIIKPGQRIAQLILENASMPPVNVVNDLVTTSRGNNGFGSTEHTPTQSIFIPTTKVDKLPTPQNYQFPSIPNDISTNTAAAAKLFSDIQTTFERPYDINLSHDPYDNHTSRTVHIKASDDDKHYGLNIILCPNRNIPKLIDCKPGTSSIRIPKWRSELRQAYITHINGEHINSMNDIDKIFKRIRTDNQHQFKIGFSTIKKQAMHPQLGVPQLYHDQMNIIGKHLWDIAHDPLWSTENDQEIAFPMTPKRASKIVHLLRRKLGKDNYWSLIKQLPKWYKLATIKKSRRSKLTRRFLIQQEDWPDWQKSEHKQLNQYEQQNTFGLPCQLPQGSNLLPLLWTYMVKDCGTKKARCVCNGSSKMKGTVTLGDTYAGSLEQTGSRIFWSATALYNFITIGADASNAFAEAPAPIAPLYVSIDRQYHEWYKDKYPDKPALPTDFVLPVQGALQGHPESARLWAKLIDRIIKELNLIPCTHEPCLYYTKNYDNTGKTVLFLRQVDDFAVACEDKTIAAQVIERINSKMTINVKSLGTISRFNGIDVEQKREYIKIYNRTYIEKMFAKHDWIRTEPNHIHNFPTPMISDPSYQRKLETTDTPTDKEIERLETKFGFGYRQAIGELIYALVTCRPDISFPVIKLSQYSTRPSEIHFEAVKNIYRYLHATIDEGIYYWRKDHRNDLPPGNIPICKEDSNYAEEDIHERSQPGHTVMFGAVDSDYAGDTTHRKSVTGIILRIAGGTIFYKTKFQDTIAMSSTEAEFTAAAEAGKYILYVRSILDQLGIPQKEATTLYEDNQGALLMANAQQPTKRTRHMDIKTFALQEWVERDLIRLKRINTTDNYSDVMTKATGRTLFYRHTNYILGKIIPSYCRQNLSILKTLYSHNPKFQKTVKSTGG